MRSCARNRKRLSAYIDGELPKRIQRSVERHLGVCPSCRRAYDELRGLAPIIEKYTVPQPPNGLTSRILAEASAQQRHESIKSGAVFRWREFLFEPWMVRGATTAALAVGLIMGAWMGWSSHRTPDSEQWMATINGKAARTLYALDVLSTEPQGSIAAATLALLGDK